MKTSIKLLSLAALVVLAAAPASRADDNTAPAAPPAEQQNLRGKHMREHRMQQLDEKLHLTADQKTQIEAIWAKADQQGRALRSDAALTPDDRKAKRREIMKTTHDQVRAVLTPDQQKIFDAMPPPGRAPGAPPATSPADGNQK